MNKEEIIQKIQSRLQMVEKEILMYDKANNIEMTASMKGEKNALDFVLNLIDEEIGLDEEN